MMDSAASNDPVINGQGMSGDSATQARMASASGLASVARGAALISILLGLITLAGWWLEVDILRRFWPGRPRVAPSMGVALIVLGAALLLVLIPSPRLSSRIRFGLGQVLAVLAAMAGLAALSEEMFGWHTAGGLSFLQGGLMSFPAALGTVGVGLGIALLDTRFRGVWLSEVLGVITIQVGLLGLMGHMFGVPDLYGSLHYRAENGMPVPSAAGVLVLGIGLLCARGERGLIALLRSHTPGGTLARRWVLTPAAALLIMGLVYLVLYRVAGAPAAIGTWALLMVSFTFLTIAIWATAQVLHRAGLEQDQAQQTLEQRVRERTADLNNANEALKAAQQDLARVNQDLEKTVQARTAHLKETIRALETVCYNIAHDLRAPNRAIAGFAQALLLEHAGSFDEAAQDGLRRIAAAAQRSDELTLDLLAYGRLGHEDLPCSPQSLDRHVREAQEKLADQIAARQASIEVDEALPEVWANPTALEQVLTNLLNNALKFVPAGTHPHVRIRAEKAGAYCRLLIQDNGIGIAPEHHRQIFEVFQRLHSQKEYPGSGIGLAIVQKSIERMGGRVGVISSKGNGSCFWFELPQSPAH
jgi:signal transduction histidine kinase